MTFHRAIPVTVIGGYLGAGKTTCLNLLLAADHGLRLAVLVNDFGAVNIDASLIARHDGETIALTNGCVCCAIADDLGTALQAQVARQPPPDRPPDHIVIEASGVADPARVMQLAGNWPGCRPAGTAVLVDAATIRVRAADKFVGRLVVQQMQAARLLVLNKLDLLPGGEGAQVRAWAQGQAGPIEVVESRFGRVDPARLLGLADAVLPVGAILAETGETNHGLSSFVLAAGRPGPHRRAGTPARRRARYPSRQGHRRHRYGAAADRLERRPARPVCSIAERGRRPAGRADRPVRYRSAGGIDGGAGRLCRDGDLRPPARRLEEAGERTDPS